MTTFPRRLLVGVLGCACWQQAPALAGPATSGAGGPAAAALERLFVLLPPGAPEEAPLTPLLLDLPDNPFVGFADPRWQRLRLSGHAIESLAPRLGEARALLGVLEASGEADSTEARAARLRLSKLLGQVGEFEAAGEQIEIAVASAERSGDSDGSIEALLERARWQRRVGALHDARATLRALEARLPHLSAAGDALRPRIIEEHGALELERGDYAAAVPLLIEALELRRDEATAAASRLSLIKRLAVARLGVERDALAPRLAAFARSPDEEEPFEDAMDDARRRAKRWGLAQPSKKKPPPASRELQGLLRETAALTDNGVATNSLDPFDHAWAVTLLAALTDRAPRAPGRRALEAAISMLPDPVHARFAPEKDGKPLTPVELRVFDLRLRRAAHASSWSVELYPRAQAVWTILLERHASAPGRESSAAAAEAYRFAAQSLLRGGELSSSRQLLEKASSATTRALGDEHLEAALARAELAHQTWHSTGSLGDVDAAFSAALARVRAVAGWQSVHAGYLLADLASVRAETGSYADARALAREASAVLGDQLAPTHPQRLRSLQKVAWALRTAGSAEEARAELERAPASTAASPCGAPHLNRELTLADLELARDRVAEARRLVQAEAARCSLPGIAQENYVALSIVLSERYAERDGPRDAEGLDEFLNRRNRRIKKVFFWGGLALGAAAVAMATAFAAFYGAALGGGASVGGGAVVLVNLFGLGSVTSSVLLVRDVAFPHFELVPAVDPNRQADFYDVVGRVLHGSGLEREAAVFARGAIVGMESGAAVGHPRLAGIYRNLAEALWDTPIENQRRRAQDESDSLAAARRSAALLDDFFRGALATLPETQSLRLVGTRPRPEEILFSGALFAVGPRPPWVEAAWEWTLHRRGLVLDELASRHRAALDAESPEVAAAWRELVAARERLATLWVRGPEAGYTHWHDLDVAVKARDEMERRLAEMSPTYRAATERRSATLDELRRRLPRGSALVEVVRVAVRRPHQPQALEHYVALLLDGKRGADVADLGVASEVDRLVADWLSALRVSYPAGFVESDSSGALLRERILDPVLARLGGAELLFVVLDGALHQVQLAALPTGDGRFVAESGPGIHILSSGRELLRPALDSSGRASSLLAFGDPDFELASEPSREPTTAALAATYRGPRPSCLPVDAQSWQALPGSRREVEEISHLYQEHGPVELLLGAAASESSLKQGARGRRFLHLATHGFFLAGDCVGGTGSTRGIGGLVVAADERESSDPLPVSALSAENPLLLSGLVLAGANRGSGGDAGGDDGIVTAEELAALDLRGVEIVALSACDTGLGAVGAGEGVFGLRRALEIAGARTILMSLWPVPDDAARLWMTEFYGRILAGDPVERATREASLANLRALRAAGTEPHPFRWAGFFAAGDWR